MPSAPSPPNVAYHQQEEDTYCGAACAQMVLHSLGVDLADPSVSQYRLFNLSNGRTEDAIDWGVAPDELTITLETMLQRLSSESGREFEYIIADTEQEITRRIIWALFNQRAAPVAVAYQGAHWVVAVDYNISQPPQGPTDYNYLINDLILQDPAPALTVDKNPPPHGPMDACGTGSDETRGHSLRMVTYSKWQRELMTPIKMGKWVGKYVAVLEKEPSGAQNGGRMELPLGMARRPRKTTRTTAGTAGSVSNGLEASSVTWPPGEVAPLLDVAEVHEYVKEGMGKYELYEREPWSTLIKGTAPDTPILVERLDYPGYFYYIVPMKVQDDIGAPMAIIVDAHTGEYHECAAVPKRDMSAMPTIPDSSEGSLVWEPSVESFSPFCPFVRSTNSNQRALYRLGNPKKRFLTPTKDVLGY